MAVVSNLQCIAVLHLTVDGSWLYYAAFIADTARTIIGSGCSEVM